MSNVRKGIARLALVLCMAVSGSLWAQAPAKYHVGIITGTVNQGEDELRGAEAMIKKYGDVKNGGMIQHLTYPNNFSAEQETTISQIVSLANGGDGGQGLMLSRPAAEWRCWNQRWSCRASPHRFSWWPPP